MGKTLLGEDELENAWSLFESWKMLMSEKQQKIHKSLCLLQEIPENLSRCFQFSLSHHLTLSCSLVYKVFQLMNMVNPLNYVGFLNMYFIRFGSG